MEWNGIDPILTKLGTFDVVFSKLTLQFIEDLDTLASNFAKILNSHGTLIFSVPNPNKIASKFKLDLNTVTFYDDEIGDTGIKIHPIHRPKRIYVEAFERGSFKLIETCEPKVPESLFEKYDVSEVYKTTPSRLNFKFIKTN